MIKVIIIKSLKHKTKTMTNLDLYIALSYLLNVQYCAVYYAHNKDAISRIVCVIMFILSPITFPRYSSGTTT